MPLERKIIDHSINFPISLAPMVGLSHICLRLLVRKYMPEDAKTIWPTEMLSSSRIMIQDVGSTPETLREPFEDNIVPQLLGNKEIPIIESITRLKIWGAKGIDINMGCPVSKALKHNYGVSLMGDVEYAKHVVSIAKNASDLPVSVKLRSGFDNNKEALVGFIQQLEDAGADWITLHPRSAEQKRRGTCEWDQIKLIRDNSSIPIIGNGDIQTKDDALKMFDQTSCDAVMIGRALCARPWLVWQIGNELGFKDPRDLNYSCPSTPEEEAIEYGKCVLETFHFHKSYFPEKLGMRKFRFYIKVSHMWLNYGLRLVGGLDKSKTWNEMEEFMINFFKYDGLRMTQKSSLRY